MYFDISLSFPRQTTLVFLYSYINVCLGYMSCKLLVLVSIFTEFTIIITVSQTHLSQYLHSAYLFIIYVYLVILHTSHVYISLWTWCIQKTCELIKFILLMHQFFCIIYRKILQVHEVLYCLYNREQLCHLGALQKYQNQGKLVPLM